MLLKSLKNYLKEFDQHGAYVNFTYNNKITYQTTIGGVITILSRLGILAFFFVIVNSIIYKDKQITVSSLGKSPTQDFQQYSIDLSNFDIAFSLSFQDNLPHITEKLNYYRYFDIKIQYVYNLYMTDANGTTYRVRQQNDVPLTNCTINRFANLSAEILNYGINQQGWFCPSNITFNLQGQIQSTNQTRFRLTVGICKNTTANKNYCASYDEIVAMASASRVSIATLNTYFNENQFGSTPIKRSLSVEPFAVTIGFTQTIQRSLRKNTIYTKDSWISQSFDNQEYMFYQDMPGQTKMATSATDFLIFTYSCDGQETFITRKVLSLADAAASAGGFASIILLISRIFAKFYSLPLYHQSILKKLYKKESFRYTPDIEWSNFKQHNTNEQFEQLKNILNNRKAIKINMIKERCISIFCGWTSSFKHSNNQRIYKQGIRQLQKALDVEKVLRTMQKVQTMEKVLLKDYQRKMLRFSTRHILRQKNPKEKKNDYEVQRLQTEGYLQKLIKFKKLSVNRALIMEILGYRNSSKEISFKLDESVKDNTINDNSMVQSKNNSTTTIRHAQSLLLMSEAENSKRELIRNGNNIIIRSKFRRKAKPEPTDF